MSRKDVTKVSKEKFLAIIQKLGMTVKDNKGFLKAYPASGTIKRSLGIPNTKDVVTRVELVGFESEVAIAHPKPPAKTVTQMLNFSQDEALILKDFNKVARELVKMADEAATAAEQAKQAAEQKATESVAAAG